MIKITESTIDLNKILLDVRDESAGAIDLFVGSVKECGSHGHVSILYYEAYKKMAENIMTQIERDPREMEYKEDLNNTSYWKLKGWRGERRYSSLFRASK